ncbi:MAG TPA: ABC transporter ATP-binding protein [Frankiaceae bacterium]|nr:ABC transporter ATP-binding protein [Frankiaceae bacterium]
MALLDVRDLTVSYGPVVALRNVTLSVEPGEIVAVIGANGAGKSTLLKSVSGLLAPRSGSIEFGGVPIAGKAAYDVITLGLAHLPEGRELFRELTVLENLHLGFWTGRADTALRDQRVEQVFGYFPRLRERAKQRAATLSGGEAQMLGVARALMCEPRLLLVDELSLGLAPMVVTQLFDILRQANDRGMSLVIVEQFVHLALGNSHRAYVLAKGEVVRSGPSAELLADPALAASYLGDSAPDAGRRRARAGV